MPNPLFPADTLTSPAVITFTDGEGRRVKFHESGLVERDGFETDQQAMAAVYKILTHRARD